MTIEIRPITAAEAKEYLRVLPYVNGFPQEEPEPSAWYAGSAAWPPQVPATAAQVEEYAEELQADWVRPQAAFVDGKIAGTSAMAAAPDGATCTAVDEEADVSLSMNELGSLYLGGVRASELSYAGRVVERTPCAVSRLDALLRPDRAPHNAVGF